MKAKKLLALLVCLFTALMLFTVMSAAADDECTHPEIRWETILQTCTQDGLHRGYCTSCNELVKTEPIPAHNYTMVYLSKVPTCTEEGVQTVYCSWCRDITDKPMPKNSDNHNFGEWKVTRESTCNVEGEMERKCTRCGEKEYVSIALDNTKHVAMNDEWEIVVEPTCHVDGVHKNVCSVCKKEFTEYLPSHYDYENTDKYTFISRVEGNCTVAASATYMCKANLCYFTVTEEKNPDAHDFTDESLWVYTPDPDGEHTGTVTKHCKHTYAHTITEKYIPHDFSGEETVITAATCVSDGLKEVKCLYCDETEEVVIPAGHVMGEWVILSGDCERGGVASRSCPCGALKEENVPFAAGTHLNYTVVADDPADCESIGWQIIKCHICSKRVEYFPENNDPLGHIPGVWEVAEEATCEKAGKKQRVCQRCGEVVEEGIIAQKVHSFVILEEGIEATCTESGITPYRYCVYCKSTFVQEHVKPHGHNFVEQSMPDENGVLICDICYEYKVTDNDVITCKCLCHNSNGLAKTVFKFINFIFKLFGMKEKCDCGAVHYDASTSIFQDMFAK